MGWEDTCARRPGTAAGAPPSAARARIGDSSGDTVLGRAASTEALLPSSASKAEQLAQTSEVWSTRKTMGMGALFVAGLWVFCFSFSHLLIYALLRITY